MRWKHKKINCFKNILSCLAHTHKHTYERTHILSHTHTYTHTYIHTHTHTHTLTHSHTHTCHLETKSLELIAKKVESASVATAFAKNDLPVPGGPYNKIPNIGMNKMNKSMIQYNESISV